MNILGAAKFLGEINQLASLVDPANGDKRWDALQAWLKTHPAFKSQINRYLKMEPANILIDICKKNGIDLKTVEEYDPTGWFTNRLIGAIGHIQQLYRDRNRADIEKRQLAPPTADFIEGEIIK